MWTRSLARQRLLSSCKDLKDAQIDVRFKFHGTDLEARRFLASANRDFCWNGDLRLCAIRSRYTNNYEDACPRRFCLTK